MKRGTKVATAAAAAAARDDAPAVKKPLDVESFESLRRDIRKAAKGHLRIKVQDNGRIKIELDVSGQRRTASFSSLVPMQAFMAKLSGEGDLGENQKISAAVDGDGAGGDEGGGDEGGGGGGAAAAAAGANDGQSKIVERDTAHFTVLLSVGDEGVENVFGPGLIPAQNDYLDSLEMLQREILTLMFNEKPDMFKPMIKTSYAAARKQHHSSMVSAAANAAQLQGVNAVIATLTTKQAVAKIAEFEKAKENEELRSAIAKAALEHFIEHANHKNGFWRDNLDERIEKAKNQKKTFVPRAFVKMRRRVYDKDAERCSRAGINLGKLTDDQRKKLAPTSCSELPSSIDNWPEIIKSTDKVYMRHRPLKFAMAQPGNKSELLPRPKVKLSNGATIEDPFWSPPGLEDKTKRFYITLDFEPEPYKSPDGSKYGVRFNMFGTVVICAYGDAPAMVGAEPSVPEDKFIAKNMDKTLLMTGVASVVAAPTSVLFKPSTGLTFGLPAATKSVAAPPAAKESSDEEEEGEEEEGDEEEEEEVEENGD